MESSPRFMFCRKLKKRSKKQQEKQKKWLRQEDVECCDSYIFVATKPKADTRRNVVTRGTLLRKIFRRILQKVKKCLSRHFKALSRQQVEKIPWNRTAECRDKSLREPRKFCLYNKIYVTIKSMKIAQKISCKMSRHKL